MQSKKQRLNEIEEIMDEEKIGFGGWLFFVQAGMALQVVFCFLGIVFGLNYGNTSYTIAFVIPVILAAGALISFYRQSKHFRWFFIAATAVLLLDGLLFFKQEGINMVFYNILLLIYLVPYIVVIICLFFSNRVDRTFCDRGKQIVMERRKNLVGTDGWLFFVLLYLFLMLANFFVLLAGVVTALLKNKMVITEIKAPGVLYIVLIAVVLAAVVICIALFIKRRLVFRYVYIGVAIMFFVLKASTLQFDYPVLQTTLEFIAQGLVIFALFNSYRVKNTFVK